MESTMTSKISTSSTTLLVSTLFIISNRYYLLSLFLSTYSLSYSVNIFKCCCFISAPHTVSVSTSFPNYIIQFPLNRSTKICYKSCVHYVSPLLLDDHTLTSLTLLNKEWQQPTITKFIGHFCSSSYLTTLTWPQ